LPPNDDDIEDDVVLLDEARDEAFMVVGILFISEIDQGTFMVVHES
jgi:hypothetical protein